MIIDRVDDKIFQIKLSEAEALRLADGSEIDYETSTQMSTHIGILILHYMIEASMFPHDKRPSIEVEL